MYNFNFCAVYGHFANLLLINSFVVVFLKKVLEEASKQHRLALCAVYGQLVILKILAMSACMIKKICLIYGLFYAT